MHQNTPHHIRDLLQGEPVDFIVQSAQDYRKRIAGKVALGIVAVFSWILLFPLMFAGPLLDVLFTGETSITVNGSLEVYTRNNMWGPFLFALIPTAISSIFIIPMIFTGVKAFSLMRKKGPWFAVTNNHLIEIDGTNASYYPWSSFEEEIKTKMYPDGVMDIMLIRKDESEKINTQNIVDSQGTSQTETLNVNVSLNGKQIDIAKILQDRISNKIVGILKVPHGSHLLNLIRHNMERFRK